MSWLQVSSASNPSSSSPTQAIQPVRPDNPPHSPLLTIHPDDNVGAAAWSAVECNVAIICACLPGTRAFLSKVLPHIFSTRSNGYRSKPTGPSHNVLTGHGNTQVLASIVGGRDPGYDHDLEDLSPSGSFNSYSKEAVKEPTGIKVTTNVTMESTSHPKNPAHDDAGSTKELVTKDSF